MTAPPLRAIRDALPAVFADPTASRPAASLLFTVALGFRLGARR